MASSAAALEESPRRIVERTRGHQHGPIVRLMSPSDLGQRLKPFVFLDFIDTVGSASTGSGMHPHSGITTLTYLMQGSVNYLDTGGKAGVLVQDGVEWMKAAGGAWHGGGFRESVRTRGFQLWIALPPELELGPSESTYLPPTAVPRDGPARVVLGSYGSAHSTLSAPSPINYLAVHLQAGERWRYQPPPGHVVCWVALSAGRMLATEALQAGDLAVFESSNAPIDFEAEHDTEFVLGSAVQHAHRLVLGQYSVHTSAAALRQAEERIEHIKGRLLAEGRL